MYPTRKKVEEMRAVIIQATCRRHAPRRMKYHPVEMNTVLTKLNEALTAGRSEIESISTLNVQRPTSNVQRPTRTAPASVATAYVSRRSGTKADDRRHYFAFRMH